MKYYIYKDLNELWRWQLVASNGDIIAEAGDSYETQEKCMKAINVVKNSDSAPIEESKTRHR
jgi:uncharacterized protein YegP (UPF0339 family)